MCTSRSLPCCSRSHCIICSMPLEPSRKRKWWWRTASTLDYFPVNACVLHTWKCSYDWSFVPRYHRINQTALPIACHLSPTCKGKDLSTSGACGRRGAWHAQKIPHKWIISPTSTSPPSDSLVLRPLSHHPARHGSRTVQSHPLKKKIIQRSDIQMQRERKIWT